MVDWKLHGKDLLKVAGVVATGIAAWNYSDDLRDMVLNYANNGETLKAIGSYGVTAVKGGAHTLRGIVPVIAPYVAYKIAKRL